MKTKTCIARFVSTAAICASLMLGGAVQAIAQNMPLEKFVDPSIVERIQESGTVDVMVLLTGYVDYVGEVDADNASALAATQARVYAAQQNVLDALSPQDFKIKHRFENILGFSGTVNALGLETLATMPEVQWIEEDGIAEAHLDQGIPLMNALNTRSSYDGTGVSVAIVDTGIDYTHSMLGGGGFPNSKVIGGYDFGDNDADPLDCQSHGTACAGISAGTLASGPGDYIGGVGNNAKLYGLKIVAGCGGSAAFSTIVAAWDWVVSHKNDDPNNPILIVNTSFGGGGSTSVCDATYPTLAAAANTASSNGITLFSSSGNDAYTNRISSPACVSGSLSVGAVYDANVGGHFYSNCSDPSTAADQITCYSNSADFLDLLAPSHDAYTTTLNGNYTSQFGGTSAASPYAAGAGAVLQSRAKQTNGSYLTAGELKSAIINSGDPITDPRNGITKPRVNVGAAVDPLPGWTYCLQDPSYAPQYQVSLEYGERVVRGQAVYAGDPGFPAPIIGTYNVNPGELLFSVDYLNESGLRFYLVNPGVWTGYTWGISDSNASLYDGPRSVEMQFCTPEDDPEKLPAETGADL